MSHALPLADCFSLIVVSPTTSPGLCPDWEAWDPNQPVENAREAMQQADDWLGVPQVHLQLGCRERIGARGPRVEVGSIKMPGQDMGENWGC